MTLQQLNQYDVMPFCLFTCGHKKPPRRSCFLSERDNGSCLSCASRSLIGVVFSAVISRVQTLAGSRFCVCAPFPPIYLYYGNTRLTFLLTSESNCTLTSSYCLPVLLVMYSAQRNETDSSENKAQEVGKDDDKHNRGSVQVMQWQSKAGRLLLTTEK